MRKVPVVFLTEVIAVSIYLTVCVKEDATCTVSFCYSVSRLLLLVSWVDCIYDDVIIKVHVSSFIVLVRPTQTSMFLSSALSRFAETISDFISKSHTLSIYLNTAAYLKILMVQIR